MAFAVAMITWGGCAKVNGVDEGYRRWRVVGGRRFPSQNFILL